MVRFSPKKRDFYTYHIVGIGNHKGVNDSDWNLLSLVSGALFPYEQGTTPGNRPGKFNPELVTAVKESMGAVIGGRTILEWMLTSNPVKFFNACSKEDESTIAELPVAKWYGPVSHFMMVLQSRVAAWKQANGIAISKLDDRAMNAASVNV